MEERTTKRVGKSSGDFDDDGGDGDYDDGIGDFDGDKDGDYDDDKQDVISEVQWPLESVSRKRKFKKR